MSEIKVGSRVRIKDPSVFLVAYQKKIKDRVGIVDKIQTMEMARYTSVSYWVIWQKRGNRGKEFRERHHLSDLEVVK